MGKTNLSNEQKDSLVHFLLVNAEEGVLEKGKINEVAKKWKVTRKTVWLWWKRAKVKMRDGESVHLPSRRVGNTNAKRVYIDKEKVMSLPKNNRRSMEKLAAKLGVGYGTVQRWVKSGILKRISSPLHPALTEANKINRLIFSLNSIYVDLSEKLIKFKDMSQQVHIDEKWFYITKEVDRYYVIPEEDVPYRACQSKRFITKVMFMCAVSRPVYGTNGEVLFDGKIGIFPFIEDVPALRSSVNRAAGTLVTKSVTSITKAVIKDCLINKIIPALKLKWPENASKEIYIQQDNARPHISDNDPEFRVAASSDGFDIHLMFQPSNSPDLNINDLGFFSSLKSLQHETVATTVLELVAAVENAYEVLVPSKLNFNFLTLQTVMIEIMLTNGHNSFTIPHMRKRVLARLGILPRDLSVDTLLVKECLEHLLQQGQGQGAALEILSEGVNQLLLVQGDTMGVEAVDVESQEGACVLELMGDA
ncbi:uncharacterized protein LOC141627685 [Silene latifolia]|uniref:uncharacterized protein LOC141627685 n=1 Tax=Silene latifolia TaxID=37657 RepID=UPI003D77AC14